MTVEERARAYTDNVYKNLGYRCQFTDVHVEQSYLAGATEDKWVTLNQKEDYPPNGELVLVRDTRDLIYINLCVNDTWHTHMGNAITHWHPLPSLPPTGNKSL